ncbi:hypothetical protein pb186bvf_007792 [Paramecium bursaria]
MNKNFQTYLIIGCMIMSSRQQTIFSSDFTENSFSTQQGWTHQYSTNSISNCQKDAQIVSVYGATNFAQQTLIFKNFDLPSHYSITVSFELWMYQLLQQKELTSIRIIIITPMLMINLQVQLWEIHQLIHKICAEEYLKIASPTFSYTANHVNSIATILMTSDVDQSSTTTSWGIRDVVVSFEACPSGCTLCADGTSVCNFWSFSMEFWTNTLITQSEGWNYQIGTFQNINCVGQNFLSVTNSLLSIQNIISADKDRILFKRNNQPLRLIPTININKHSITKAIRQDALAIKMMEILSLVIPRIFHIHNLILYNLQLQFSSNTAQNTRFFGIRDLYIFISPCINNCQLCTNSNDCQSCQLNYLYDGISQCVLTPTPSIYTYSGYKQFFNAQIFPNNADYTFTTNIWTECNGFSLLGGYLQLNKVYINLTTSKFHNRLRLRANIYMIDNWKYDNPLQLLVDGQLKFLINRNKYDSINRGFLCGNSLEPDNIHNLDLTFDHVQNFTILDFKTLDQSKQQYFGVRDIQIDNYYCGPKYKCATCDPTGTTCLSCSDPGRLLANNCECALSPGITSQTCPSCDDALYNQRLCPGFIFCTQPGSYIAYCIGICKTGFTYDSILNQCNLINPTPLDSYNQELIQYIQQFNSLTYNSVNNWILYDLNNNLISNPIGSCGSQNVLGGVGYNGKISLLINDLPPFRRIRFFFTAILIDLEEGYTAKLYINHAEIRSDSVDNIPRIQNLCGTSTLDAIITFDLVIQVTGQIFIEITLPDKYNNPSPSTYFGVYNITLSYQLCADIIRCATCDDTGCLTCSVPERVQGPQCLCGSYDYGNYAECPTCPYKCQQNSCNQLGCLTCANLDRGSPPDCLCQTYEIYGESSCPPCQLNCLHCTPTMCLQCEAGYYAMNQYCYKCPYQCQTCLNNGCLTCSDPQRGPAPFCRCPTYEIIGQKECPSCPNNCQTCDSTGCLVCNNIRLLPLCGCPSNYYEVNNQCIQCETNCLTCNQNQCLTCQRLDLTLPLCVCPSGSVEVNNSCIFGVQLILSYGYFDQSLKQINISFNKEFIIQGFDNQWNLVEENCLIIQNSKGLCQIQNQQIIYQFDKSLKYQLDDLLKIDTQYIKFNNVGLFQVQDIVLALSTDIDYKPKFDLTYPSNVLICNQYIISIENIINIGYQDYQIEILNEGIINYTIQNKNILIKPLVVGNLSINIKVINHVNEFSIKLINIYSSGTFNVNFEILPKLGQLNYQFDLIIFVQNILIRNCVNDSLQNVSKIIDLNFGDLIIMRSVTKNNQYKFNINVGMLSINQIYKLNVTITYQNYTNTILKNYTISQINPYFSIIGGNRMINNNYNLNVSAIVVDPDNKGLICEWQCVMYLKIIKIAGSILHPNRISYQFTYNCLGIEARANYYITDINQSQLFILYPIYLSTYSQNSQNPIQFYIFNETQNMIQPIMFENISIKVIQNQLLQYMTYQSNSFGQQYVSNLLGNVSIQAQINSMISSFNINLGAKLQNLNMITNIQQGIPLQDVFQFSLSNFDMNNPPYLYQYFVQLNQNITYQLCDWSQNSQQQFILPQGSLSNNYSILIILQIIDGLGLTNNITQQVVVYQANEQKVDLLLQQLQNNTFLQNNLVTLGYQFIQLQEDGCLQNCSNQGKCIQNKCTCNDNFYLNDCSANLTQFQNLYPSVNQLISIMIDQQETTNSIYNNLIYQLLQNQYIYSNINQNLIQKLINTTIFNLLDFFNSSTIQSSDIDAFIRKIPQIEQQLIDQENQQNLFSLIKLLDISFGLVGFDSPIIFENKTIQNQLNMQLVNTTNQLSLYKGLQQYIDQSPYQLDLKYINIITQKVSVNQSQIFFQIPQPLYEQINKSEYQLQNESIISSVIYKTNPYLADSNFPYSQINTQVASIQIADSKGKSYRSFHPVTVSFKSNQSSTKEVCACQKNDQWINNICQTIKLTNSKEVICNCEVVNQINMITVVNDFQQFICSFQPFVIALILWLFEI